MKEKNKQLQQKIEKNQENYKKKIEQIQDMFNQELLKKIVDKNNKQNFVEI